MSWPGAGVEPSARVSYVSPPPIDRSDLVFFRLRWSEAWTKTTFDTVASQDTRSQILIATGLESPRNATLIGLLLIVAVVGIGRVGGVGHRHWLGSQAASKRPWTVSKSGSSASA